MVFTARKNLKLYVSDRQVEILVGCLLGDAYLTKLGKIQIEQSGKQEDYIRWKHKELSSISYSGLKNVVRFDKKDNRVTRSLRFWTRQYFRSWREIFYQQGNKVFPKDLSRWITPLSIAVWFMDDGSYNQKSNCIFCTQSFDEKSQLELVKVLQSFGIEVSLRKDRMSRVSMRIRSKSLNKFFELVRPYIHSSMYYKIP